MHIPARARVLMGLSQTGDLGPFTIYTDARRRPVWFLKSPPAKPPSPRQVLQRNAFRMAAKAWQQIGAQVRAEWNAAARHANLYLNGYTLWVHYQTRRDRRAIQTIERLTGRTLLPR